MLAWIPACFQTDRQTDRQFPSSQTAEPEAGSGRERGTGRRKLFPSGSLSTQDEQGEGFLLGCSRKREKAVGCRILLGLLLAA